MNATDLYPYFETKVAAILHKLGKHFMAWDDVYEKAPGAVTPGKVSKNGPFCAIYI
jgi:N-acetyl-beta-hexosaminidase